MNDDGKAAADDRVGFPPQLAERYELIGLLGEGGMGRVFHAVEKMNKRHVAVKVLHAEVANAPGFRLRLGREAQVSRYNIHPAIVQFVEADVDCDPPYIIFDYVGGVSLSRIIKKERPLSKERVLRIGTELADCLGVLHERNIIHRDLKPDNIVTEPNGRCRILDLGIATGDDFTAMTKTGIVLGTPLYIAPEVLLGEKVTPSADIFALGVILLECVSPEDPLAALRDMPIANMLSLRSRSELKFKRPKGCEPALWNIIERLMEPDKNLRPANGKEVLNELSHLAETEESAAKITLFTPPEVPKKMETKETKREKYKGAQPIGGLSKPMRVIPLLIVLICCLFFSNELMQLYHGSKEDFGADSNNHRRTYTSQEFTKMLDDALKPAPLRIDSKALRLVPAGKQRQLILNVLRQRISGSLSRSIGEVKGDLGNIHATLERGVRQRIAMTELFFSHLDGAVGLKEQQAYFFTWHLLLSLNEMGRYLKQLRVVAAKRSLEARLEGKSDIAANVKVQRDVARTKEHQPEELRKVLNKFRYGDEVGKNLREIAIIMDLIEGQICVEFGPVKESEKFFKKCNDNIKEILEVGEHPTAIESLLIYAEINYLMDTFQYSKATEASEKLTFFLLRPSALPRSDVRFHIALSVTTKSLAIHFEPDSGLSVENGIQRFVSLAKDLSPGANGHIVGSMLNKIAERQGSYTAQRVKAMLKQ